MNDATDSDAGVASTEPQFRFSHGGTPSDAVIAGFSQYGLAGLTAVDYLIDQLDLRETGHVTVDNLPAITPFQNGQPRHHTRFFGRDDLPVTILVSELFIPLVASDQFSDALLDWIDATDIGEVAILTGVPIRHGPDDHRTFFIATDDYREARLQGSDVPAMGNGFLDGVNASILARGMDTSLRTAVYVTPVHAPVPDVEAAIRLLDTVSAVYDLQIDTTALETFASEVSQYYENLSERVEAVEERQKPDDRMYM